MLNNSLLGSGLLSGLLNKNTPQYNSSLISSLGIPVSQNNHGNANIAELLNNDFETKLRSQLDTGDQLIQLPQLGATPSVAGLASQNTLNIPGTGVQTSSNPTGQGLGVTTDRSGNNGIGMSNYLGAGLSAATGITDLFNINNTRNLNTDQKRIAMGDSGINTIGNVASQFGPVGAAIGGGLKVLNSIGGSLIGTPKAIKDYKVNDLVAGSSGYTGIAAGAKDAGASGQSYAKAGLFGKLLGGKDTIVNKINDYNNKQSKAAGVLETNQNILDRAAGSTAMRASNELNKIQGLNNNWYNGSIRYGQQGMKMLPKVVSVPESTSVTPNFNMSAPVNATNSNPLRDQLVRLTGNTNLPFSVSDYNKLSTGKYDRSQALADQYRNNAKVITIKDPKYNIRNNQQVNTNVLDDIVKASVKNGIDPYTTLAIAQRETGIGHYSDKDRQQRETGPLDVFSNWDARNNGLTAEEQQVIANAGPTGTIPARIYNKALNYTNKTNQYPFQGEMKTIVDKTKSGTFLRGYNYGDPDYPNKIAKEREILMSPQNQTFRNYVDSVANIPVARMAEGGELIEMDKKGKKLHKIHIKKANRGKFTAYKKRTGKTTEEALHSPDPHVRKMANFAKNARKWKHEFGGVITSDTLIEAFKDGGSINTKNVIVNGALHARKHSLKELEQFKDANITHKGVAVVTIDAEGGVLQQAEVEGGEVVLHLALTKKLEALYKEGTDEAAIKAGKILARELMRNTNDKTGTLKSIKNKGLK